MLIFFSLFGFFSFLYFHYFKNQTVAYIDPQSSYADGQVQIGGDFSLIDHYGKTRTNQEFKGKYMLVYFGYTFCPDICPMALQNISKAIELLSRDRESIVPIFITLDPERDTKEVLEQYATHFHPSFIFLSGTQSSLDSVKKAYKVFSDKRKDPSMVGYLMDHTTLIYLMDRNGKYIKHFSHTEDPEKIKKVIEEQLLKEHRKKVNG